MGPTRKYSEIEKKKLYREMKKKHKQQKLLEMLDKSLEPTNIGDNVDMNEDDVVAPHEEKPCQRTLSIAVPGSILENAQSVELRTYLAGQIARAACIYKVDEVVVYDDLGVTNERGNAVTEEGKAVKHCCLQLGRILQYLECPQYLRKFFFPLHKDLQYSGLLNPLDAPHHLRQSDRSTFREGVVSKKRPKAGHSTVYVGLPTDAVVDMALTPGLRVTVKLRESSGKKLRGSVVSPSAPRLEDGVYWGYQVRVAESLSAVFSRSPYEGGYDLTVGTSDKGTDISKDSELPDHLHALAVFGGLQGLEAALENDESLKVDDPALLFDRYLNTCPTQGSRTIRTEEAVLISLAVLCPRL